MLMGWLACGIIPLEGYLRLLALGSFPLEGGHTDLMLVFEFLTEALFFHIAIIVLVLVSIFYLLFLVLRTYGFFQFPHILIRIRQ